jgi:hypothetical protein
MKEALLFSTALKLALKTVRGGRSAYPLPNLVTDALQAAKILMDGSGFGEALEKSQGKLAEAVAGAQISKLLNITKPAVGKA